MFLAGEDDDDDFIPTKNTNLATLFGKDASVGQLQQQTENTSLKYTAPKQPPLQTKQQHSNPSDDDNKTGNDKQQQLSLIHSTVVQAYKFNENNQPLHQGKLGIAILGHHMSCNYVLLLYRTKQQTLSRSSISPQFTYTVQANNYASFYDDQRHSWSVNFDSSQSAIDFAKQVALAKYNSFGVEKFPYEVFIQDLQITSSGPGLQKGDVALIKLTSWLLTDYSFGNIVDGGGDRGRRMKIKEGGLERGLLGMHWSGHQRLVILPPKAQPDGGQSAIIYHVETLNDDMTEASTDQQSLPQMEHCSKPSMPPKPSSTSSSEDPILNVKARSTSISKQLQQQSPKSSKAKLISRMARMGQSLLPAQPVVHTEPEPGNEEWEEEGAEGDPEEEVMRKSPSPDIVPKPIPRYRKSPTSSNEALNISVFHQQPTYPMPLVPGNPFMMVPGNQSLMMDTQLPTLLSELRTQNTELRFQMGMMADKVEKVLSKMDKHSGGTPEVPLMESGILSENVRRIVMENELQKSEIQEKNRKIESLTEKMADLLTTNHKLLEEKSQRSSLDAEVVEIRKKLELSQKREAELEKELQSVRKGHSELEGQSSKFELECADLRKKMDEMKIAEEERKAATGGSEAPLSGEVKKIMNAVYRNLQKQFDGSESYPGSDVRAILANTIRDITVQLTEHLDVERLANQQEKKETEERKSEQNDCIE